jgi:hypothetical protein
MKIPGRVLGGGASLARLLLGRRDVDEWKADIREASTAGVLEVRKEQNRRPESNIQILGVAV